MELWNLLSSSNWLDDNATTIDALFFDLFGMKTVSFDEAKKCQLNDKLLGHG